MGNGTGKRTARCRSCGTAEEPLEHGLCLDAVRCGQRRGQRWLDPSITDLQLTEWELEQRLLVR